MSQAYPSPSPLPRGEGKTGYGSRLPPSGGFELFAWYFMRISGVLLLFLALGHLLIMHVINNVKTIDYAFVARRFTTPFWRTYDWLMLMLALLHGVNGLRVITDDYLKGGWRAFAQAVLYALAFIFVVLGSLVLLTFQPK